MQFVVSSTKLSKRVCTYNLNGIVSLDSTYLNITVHEELQMNISKPFKILVGIGTLWFAIYPLIFIALWFMMAVGMGFFPLMQGVQNSPNPEGPFMIFPFFGVIFPIHFCTIFLGFGLMVFYLIHVIKNTKADETIRIILGVGTFFLSFIAMPIYYYLYIWLDNPPAWAAAKNKQDNPQMATVAK